MNLSESELLEKWLADKSFVNWVKNANEAHVRQWESYFEQHPESKELGALGKFAVVNLSTKNTQEDTIRSKAAYKRLRKTLDNRTSKKQAPVIPFYKKWQSAAAVLLIMSVGLWGYFQFNNTPNQIIIASDYGETQRITLEDNSKIVLNANSTLRYNKDQPRQVWLKGEAFFEVAKKSTTNENFQVFTNDLTVEVLGTVFNVKNRNDQTKVFLEEGKVMLSMAKQQGNTIEMAPGDLVSYSKKQQKVIEKRTAKAIDNTSWKNGVIRFREASLSEALDEISAIYGIQFVIKEKEKNEQLLSGGVPIHNLSITLATLNEVYGLAIEQQGAVYLVERNEDLKE